MEIENSINGERREYSRATEDWVRTRISRLGSEAEVILYLKTQGVNLALAHPSKALDNDKTISNEALRTREREIWESWLEFGLDREHLDLTMLLEFLHLLKP